VCAASSVVVPETVAPFDGITTVVDMADGTVVVVVVEVDVVVLEEVDVVVLEEVDVVVVEELVDVDVVDESGLVGWGGLAADAVDPPTMNGTVSTAARTALIA
jgi:hypothetical protein